MALVRASICILLLRLFIQRWFRYVGKRSRNSAKFEQVTASDLHLVLSSIWYIVSECCVVHLRHRNDFCSMHPFCVQLEQDHSWRPLHQSNDESDHLRGVGNRLGYNDLVTATAKGVEITPSAL